jgi:hypothetical protein
MTRSAPSPRTAALRPGKLQSAAVTKPCLTALAVYGALCVSYVFGISAFVGDDHYPLSLSPERIALGGVTTLFLGAIAGDAARPASLLSWVFVAIIVLPSLVMAACGGLPIDFAALALGAFVICAAASRMRLPLPSLDGFIRADVVEFGSLAVSIAVLAALATTVGRSGFNVDLSMVYSFRASAKESMSPALLYLVHVCTKVMLPAALCFALHNRSVLRASLCLVTWFMFFGLSGHKAILAYPFVTGAAFVLANSRHALLLLMGSLVTLCAIGTIDLFDYDSRGQSSVAKGWIGYALLRGSLFQPTLLNYYYWDFFSSTKEFLFWSESRVTFGLVASPLQDRLVFTIGATYFAQPEMAANTGLIGSGFANGGLLGVALYAVLLGTSFSWLDSLRRRLPSSVICGIAATPVLTILTGTDFPTALLTHGGLAAFVILLTTKSPKRPLTEMRTGAQLGPRH